jgi:PAS domain S-box-containing protein
VNSPRILHLEDSALDGDLVRECLRAGGISCAIDRVSTREAFVAALTSGAYELILADRRLPNFDGEAALNIAHAIAPEIPFIFVSGTPGEDIAVEALKRGATDYVVKQHLARLPGVTRRALSEAAERIERERAAETGLAETGLGVNAADFAMLVDAMPQLCWSADSAGSINWYNRRWYDYTGTTPEEMQRRGWQSVHDPDRLPEVLRRWTAAIDSGKSFEMIFPLRGADGVFRPFLTRTYPVRNTAGKVVRWLGTNTDVSAQREAEEALRRLNETLEQRIVDATAERQAMMAKLHDAQRMETIGQLTGGVAHDFNNLLTPIVGSFDILQTRLPPDDRSQRLIRGGLQAAERAKTLVQRLLAFSRQQVLEPRAVDVASLVEEMRELIVRSLSSKISLEIAAPDTLAAARIDPHQLELALLNLAVNARDAMPEGGALRIALDERQVGPGDGVGLRHGTYVRLAVTDTGTGMDATTLKSAIEPFYTTKGVGKGTGLGLSMVHGLAAQSGGTLILSSEPGCGTRAEIWLPAASAQADAGNGVAQPGDLSIRPFTILLVDDEVLVRNATFDMLTELGHQVIEASSGAQALDLLRRGAAPDLVITDYLMPVMNGAELAQEIKSGHPELPILLLTGYASLAGNKMADLALLPKPFRQTELAATIDRLVLGPLLASAVPAA